MSYDNTRYIPIVGGRAASSSDVYNLAGRLRAAYEFSFASFYVRPRVDLDLIHVSMPAFAEWGRTGAELSVAASSLTTFVATPAVEFGGRIDMADGVVLRPYLTLGASFASNDAWLTTARFQAAPLSAGSFITTTPLPDILGNLDLGLQAVTRDNLELKIEYGLNAGQDYISQRGMARFAVHF
jgi:outer membrane autotransporter protein